MESFPSREECGPVARCHLIKNCFVGECPRKTHGPIATGIPPDKAHTNGFFSTNLLCNPHSRMDSAMIYTRWWRLLDDKIWEETTWKKAFENIISAHQGALMFLRHSVMKSHKHSQKKKTSIKCVKRVIPPGQVFIPGKMG